MKFAEILERFRTLGGIAENIELRHGQYGRGIFPINPNLPLTIVTPKHLLVSPSWLTLDSDNHIRVNPRLGLDSALIDFYENYHQFFGWGDAAIHELSAYHNELIRLPKRLKQFLILFGWLDTDFDKKSVKHYLHAYLASRQIRIEGESKLMPILELINHSHDGKPYRFEHGIKFTGTFKGEALACYHSSLDALHFFRTYHFNSESTTVLSCNVKIEIPNIGLINISRFDAMIDIKDGVVMPKMIKKESEIQINFLELVNTRNKFLPRKIFIDGVQTFGVTVPVANQIFDGLIDHNRKVYNDFISECRLSTNKVAKELESIALLQLKLLIA